MKKILIFLFFLIATLFAVAGCQSKMKYQKQLPRDITLIDKEIDYQSFFNDFKNQEIKIDKINNTAEFKAVKEIDARYFDSIDFVNFSENKNKVEFEYDVKYDANKNNFNLSITANSENGKVVDNWEGTPYITKNGKIDIAFSTDNGVVYLSELEESGVLNSCGWFSRLFRKIAIVAAAVATVAAVVAITIVAAPVVVAVVPAFAGVSATVTAGGAACAAGMAMTAAAAGAVASSSFAVAATTCLVASITALISSSVSKIADELESLQTNLTLKRVKEIVKEATRIKEYQDSNETYVLLGRLNHLNTFYNVEDNVCDCKYTVIRFYLTSTVWDSYQNLYKKRGMWLINKAFLNMAILAEKTKNWKFGLVTDYREYPEEKLKIDEYGYFYQEELTHLRRTNHSFSDKVKKHGFYYVYYN